MGVGTSVDVLDVAGDENGTVVNGVRGTIDV
jgi:hypothetical protein